MGILRWWSQPRCAHTRQEFRCGLPKSLENDIPFSRLRLSAVEVSDCDLWVSGTVFKSDGVYTSHLCPDSTAAHHGSFDSFVDADCIFSSARWGIIANNTIMNGGACHWFDQAQQVIFENNTCTGNNPMSMGNNIDTYGGGFAQHVYLHANRIASVVRRIF